MLDFSQNLYQRFHQRLVFLRDVEGSAIELDLALDWKS